MGDAVVVVAVHNNMKGVIAHKHKIIMQKRLLDVQEMARCLSLRSAVRGT
jgi:hypothetical protein